MSVSVVNWGDLEWREFSAGTRYAAQVARISPRLGARKLGYSAWIVPPGKVSIPYHYHLVNEEMAVVLGGGCAARLNGKEYPLEEGDLVALPPGADSAHQFINRGDRPVHLLLASTMRGREVAGYPDSQRRLYAVGGLAHDPSEASVFVLGDRILDRQAGYLEGEPIDEPLGPAPETPPETDPRIVSMKEIPWETHELGPFSAKRKRLSRAAGARFLGCSLYQLPPGGRAWPYHFHHVNEEFFFVRSGHGRLRTADGERDIRPGDAFACPTGPEGAHAITNPGDATLEYFALSTMESPEVCEYPDSGKISVMVGAAPGGETSERSVDLVFRRVDAVDYLDGEG